MLYRFWISFFIWFFVILKCRLPAILCSIFCLTLRSPEPFFLGRSTVFGIYIDTTINLFALAQFPSNKIFKYDRQCIHIITFWTQKCLRSSCNFNRPMVSCSSPLYHRTSYLYWKWGLKLQYFRDRRCNMQIASPGIYLHHECSDCYVNWTCSYVSISFSCVF